MTKRERLSSPPSGCDSMRGREISMCAFHLRPPGPLYDSGWPWSLVSLLGVELDDELLLQRHLVLVPGRHREDREPGLTGAQLEPARLGPAGLELDRLVDVEVAAHLLLDLDDVARLHLVGGDVDLPAVVRDVGMAHELPGLVARAGQAAPVGDVVQTRLEELQQHLAGDPLPAGRLLVVVVELRLEHAVDAARLLLLTELQ